LWEALAKRGVTAPAKDDPVINESVRGSLRSPSDTGVLQALRRASTFVSHGSMGSVLEALYDGVPLVVMSHTPQRSVPR
jgi:hypothetical protein